ncbi:hypothetical protein B0T17DRAFT_545522 [Bombardia bombarda]|uniref:Uncharacterized protein n=1 Tax=Bombardia bombarda TaxID=252184 RepID=A0AA39T0S6_9PEZI|nr:hypothetical protein B0T17DRAFT_545522 [Bombardia bombarda]
MAVVPKLTLQAGIQATLLLLPLRYVLPDLCYTWSDAFPILMTAPSSFSSRIIRCNNRKQVLEWRGPNSSPVS